MCDPWHPWYGRTVAVREALIRRHQAVLHCGLEPDDGGKALEIPHWMVERVVCCTMHLAATPQVSCDVLGQMKAVLEQAAAALVQQTQPSFLDL